MSGQPRPVVRQLAGLLALATAVTALGLGALAAGIGLTWFLALGAAGAVAATVLLLRVHRGANLSRRASVVLVVGLALPVITCVGLVRAFGHSFDKAYMASVKSDLRNLVAAQDAYFAQHRAYAGTLADLSGFQPSSGVTLTLTVSGQNVQAIGRHAQVRRAACAIFIGAAPVAPATVEREPACSP